MNTNALKGQMVAHGDRQEDLAKALGISRSSMNYKLNGRVQFRQDEMNIIRERYALTGDDMVYIFFDD